MSIRSVALKIARAEEHLASLQSLIDTVRIGANDAILSARFDSGSNEAVLYIDAVPDLTEDCERASLILGDILHNLRSALDHLAFGLAVSLGGNPEDLRYVQFPITKKQSDFASERRTRLRHIDDQFHTRIEALQPYPNRTDQHVGILRLLRDLSNQEKHRTLVGTAAVPQELSLTLRGGKLGLSLALAVSERLRGDERWALRRVAFRPNEEIARCESPFVDFDTVQMGYLKPHFMIEGEGWLLPTARQMITTVTAVVQQFPELDEAP